MPEAFAIITICVAAIIYVVTRAAIIEFRSMVDLCQRLAKDLATAERKLRISEEHNASLEKRNFDLSDTLAGIRAAMGIEEE